MATLIFAAGAMTLAGCTMPSAQDASAKVYPSQGDTNVCGVYGTCTAAPQVPQPLHGDFGAY
jgi:hypothetical protein